MSGGDPILSQAANFAEVGVGVASVAIAIVTALAATAWSRESKRLKETFQVPTLLPGAEGEAQQLPGSGNGATTERLLAKYHSQGLGQATVSFWLAVVLSGAGFVVILGGAFLAFQAGRSDLTTALPIIAGVLADGVAVLIFRQTNQSRQLMADFFDRLRSDRRVDEALKLADSIEEPEVASRLKAYLALHFAGVEVSVDAIRSVAGQPVKLSTRADSAGS